MPKTKLKNFLKQISIYSSVIVLGIILAIAIQIAYASWTEPPSGPPGGNAPAPINVGTTPQTRGGTLIVATTSNSYLGIGGAYRLERNGNSLAFTNKEGTTTMIIGDDGNVGIGTNSPGSPLEIKSSSDGILRLRKTGGGWNYLEYYNDSGRTLWMGMINDNLFGINGQLSLDTSNGNVGIGIGTTNPGEKLEVNGDIKIESGNGIILNGVKKTSWPSPGPSYWAASGSDIYNTNSGKVEIKGPDGAIVTWYEKLGNYGHDVYGADGGADKGVYSVYYPPKDSYDGDPNSYHDCPIDKQGTYKDWRVVYCHNSYCWYYARQVTCKLEYRMSPQYTDYVK